MNCSFTNIPFLLPSQDVSDFCNYTIFSSEPNIAQRQNNYPGNQLMGLTVPINGLPQHTPKLNEFFYPFGMSRWSEFRGLVDSDGFNAMSNNTVASNGGMQAGLFVIAQENGRNIETLMYMLPPRAISAPAFGFNSLWMVTLVDERFFMQSTPQTITNVFAISWDTYMRRCWQQFGINAQFQVDTIHPALGFPNPDTDLANQWTSAARCLDAAAYSCGGSIVRSLDGNYAFLRYNTSALTVAVNTSPGQLYELVGGANFYNTTEIFGVPDRTRNAVFPSSVTLTFPIWICGIGYLNANCYHIRHPNTTGDKYIVIVPIKDMAAADTFYTPFLGNGQTKVFHSGAKAAYIPTFQAQQEQDFSPGIAAFTGEQPAQPVVYGPIFDTTVPPSNIYDLEEMAFQIAFNYYESLRYGQDIIIPGIYPWLAEGLDDVIWHAQNDKCFTRVQTMPFNLNYEEALHYLQTCGSIADPSCCSSLVVDIGCDSQGNTIVNKQSFYVTPCPVFDSTLHT